MQFTPQQLMGAGRYAPCTRLGNWNEDLMLEEARMKEFELRKTQGSLLATHKLKNDFLHQPAPRSFESSGNLHFNLAIGIKHVETGSALACNVFEETPCIGSGEYVVTAIATSGATASCARNTFRIISPTEFKSVKSGVPANFLETAGSVLHYGEPFMLMANEALLVDEKSVLMREPLFLKTSVKNERSMSPITYNQRIYMAPIADSSALWTCVRADLAGREKMLSSGEEVCAGDRISIVHKMTGKPLFTEAGNKQPTDFGLELEVCGCAARSTGKRHNLAGEVAGTRTADTIGMASLPPNTWSMMLASRPEDAIDNRLLPAFPNPDSVISVIQKCIAAPSLYSYRAFMAALAQYEVKGSSSIDRDECMWFLKKFNLPLRDGHFDILFNAFDMRQNGHFPLQNLVAALRIAPSSTRERMMTQAYDRLSSWMEGVSLDALCASYDPRIDVRMHDGTISHDQAMKEYRELWSNSNSGGRQITLAEFLEVYADISAVVLNDEHFTQLLEESWKCPQ